MLGKPPHSNVTVTYENGTSQLTSQLTRRGRPRPAPGDGEMSFVCWCGRRWRQFNEIVACWKSHQAK